MNDDLVRRVDPVKERAALEKQRLLGGISSVGYAEEMAELQARSRALCREQSEWLREEFRLLAPALGLTVEQMVEDAEVMAAQDGDGAPQPRRHDYDDEGICRACGLDGAEATYYSQRGYAHEYPTLNDCPGRRV